MFAWYRKPYKKGTIGIEWYLQYLCNINLAFFFSLSIILERMVETLMITILQQQHRLGFFENQIIWEKQKEEWGKEGMGYGVKLYNEMWLFKRLLLDICWQEC